MNNDHFAIVIGLASYPDLGDPPPANLDGPENDADAIADWLADPAGGGLPAQNIKKVKSIDAESPPNPAPTPSDLNKAFVWLDQLAAKNRPRKVGTRLYLYVSGHGFSPRPGSGCLLAGNAADRQYSANISPSAWLDWLRDAAYFNEYVLWMDCCMDRVVLTQPSPPPLDPLGGGGIGKAFIAFGAPRPLKAAEKKIGADNGRYHGVFTWNLLQALRGAAAGKGDLVKSDTLANWLRQAQLAWLDDNDRANPSVAKEPAIVAQDPGIVFAKGVRPFDFDVTLRIPSAVADTQIFLWSGNPPARDQNPITITPGGTRVPLKPGLYLAEGGGLRHGFVVTRASIEIDLVDKGDPVKPSASSFTMRVAGDDLSADIRLCDGVFGDVMGGTAELVSPPLPFGLYLIRRTTGRQITEKVILLDGDWPPPALEVAVAAALPPVPPITSAAPLPGTRATHEYHEGAAADQRVDVDIAEGAELLVMARWFSKDGRPVPDNVPWRGVSVLDATGAVIADLEKDGRHDTGGDPVAACSIRLAPGSYQLRYPMGAMGLFAQSLIIPPGGWRMEAYLLHTDSETNGRPAISLLMRKAGQPWGGDDDVQLQKAVIALADERPVLNEQLLSAVPANPLARIVGAHLLLLSVRDRPEVDAMAAFDRLNQLVSELRTLVGTEHPDVEALSLKCSDAAIRTAGPVRMSPMFERSWELLLEGSQSRSDLVPPELWARVHAAAEFPPYLVWSEDGTVQSEYQKALAEVIFAKRKPPATAVMSSADYVKHAVEETLRTAKSATFDRLGKLSVDLESIIKGHAEPPASSAFPPSGPVNQVSDQEVARRARKLNLPPVAVSVLRQALAAQGADVIKLLATTTGRDGA